MRIGAMLLALARKWTAVRVHPFQGHGCGRLGHLETPKLTISFFLFLVAVGYRHLILRVEFAKRTT
jgi:hypothetical protein